ncbi:efflux RND transporter periplasmic adaptor subunit [Flavobacterium araucananum]|nr:efflux RND transporter periplasmic adaptor subunit [Flavobacterium araucananum]
MKQNKIKKNTMKNIFMAITAAVLCAACGSDKKDPVKETEDPIQVKAEKVAAVSMANEISVSGNIEGATTVKMGFMVPGKINLITSKVGQFVTKGQLIASLDPTNYALNKQLADVELSEVTDEYGRLKILHSRGSLSQSDFSKIGFALQKAQAQQKLELKKLNDTKLHSPINGVLLSKQAETGEIIDAGTELFVVSDIKKVTVLAFVPEGELNGLHIGQAANVHIAALDKTFAGRITEIGSIADAASRAFTIKIEVANIGMQIRPGMIAEARIIITKPKTGIQLPTECIISDLGNQSFVYVVDKNEQKAFKRKVSLGKMIANKIEILSGLALGETVITSGQTKLSDGVLISIENK